MFQKRKQLFFSYSLNRHFGKTVEAVGKSLLTYGGQSLSSIISKNSSLHPEKVVQSLLVLLQHGLVTASSKDKKPSYSLDANMFHYRLNMAWYIVNVRERFGSDAGIIFEALCKHGKLTRTALLATATKVKVTQEYTVEKIPEDLTDIRTKLSDCFEKLVRRRVIRRADTFQKRFTEKIRVPRNKRVGYSRNIIYTFANWMEKKTTKTTTTEHSSTTSKLI
mmetsp:Transcript_18234/g.25637  ORF Transcript_18234/g.25637 Transcript_18234/m.25637 type:complete len:221 (+) Transcript_18234:44-706(+)